MSGTFTCPDWPGVALVRVGYVQRWEPSSYLGEDDEGNEVEVEDPSMGEWVGDPEWSRVVMVGDDRVHEVETSELVPLDESKFCAECGQVGCTADGRQT